MGKFEYRVSVPSDVDGDKIDANLEDGILTVRIPKPERVQPRKVEVKSAE
jgi:HSP20 family protein